MLELGRTGQFEWVSLTNQAMISCFRPCNFWGRSEDTESSEGD